MDSLKVKNLKRKLKSSKMIFPVKLKEANKLLKLNKQNKNKQMNF